MAVFSRFRWLPIEGDKFESRNLNTTPIIYLYTFTFLENRITPCGYYRRRCVPRQSFDRARQYGIHRREWDRKTAHGYIKSMLLRLIGERGMGQNDPYHTDDLSVTKMKALRFIEERGSGQKDPHHTDGLSVTSPKTERTLCPLGYLPCKCGCRPYILKIRLRRTTE